MSRYTDYYNVVAVEVKNFLQENQDLNKAHAILQNCLTLQTLYSEIENVSDDRDHALSLELTNIKNWIHILNKLVSDSANNNHHHSDCAPSGQKVILKLKIKRWLNSSKSTDNSKDQHQDIDSSSSIEKRPSSLVLSAEVKSLNRQAELAIKEMRHNDAKDLLLQCIHKQYQFKNINKGALYYLRWNLGNCYLHLVNQSLDLAEKVVLLERAISQFESAEDNGGRKQKTLCQDKVEKLTELLHYYEFLPFEEEKIVQPVNIDHADQQSDDDTYDVNDLPSENGNFNSPEAANMLCLFALQKRTTEMPCALSQVEQTPSLEVTTNRSVI